jgi:phosphocarrier protein
MISKQMTIINKLGLHARAAARFVLVSNSFISKITLINNNKSVNGKSIMSLMMLSLVKGSIVKIECDGSDEKDALRALCHLINNYFGEDG